MTISGRRALYSAVAITAGLATFQLQGSAQSPKPNPVSCPKGVFENDDDLGAVEYRGGANGSVFVLPAKGSIFQLLPFEFETPDRIHLIGVACTLVRAKAAVPAAPTPPRSR
jgi:hypothetical protein